MMNNHHSFFIRVGTLAASLSLACSLFVSGPLLAEEKNPAFQELKGLGIPAVKPGFSKVEKPLEILKRKDLKAILGKGKAMMELRKRVDFEKQKVLLFRWNGSGKDTLTARTVAQPGVPAKIIFNYTPGLTRDIRFHAKVFALDTKIGWEVTRKGQAVVKAAFKVVPKPGGLILRADVVPVPVPGKAAVKAKPVIPPNPFIPPRAGVIRGGKPVVINGRVPIPNRARSMRIYQQWTGFLPNGEPSIGLPEKGYISDEETWIELWNAWKPTEKVPAVNFRNEIVLVGALPNKTRVYVRAVTMEAGEVTLSVNGSGQTTSGLSYSFAKVMRIDITSINGVRLPGAPD